MRTRPLSHMPSLHTEGLDDRRTADAEQGLVLQHHFNGLEDEWRYFRGPAFQR